jgi:two-component system chemotaxis response regulator CheB
LAAGSKALAPLPRDKLGLVLVGVSTGGPGTLEEILPHLPAGFPWPMVIAQHMPSSFTGLFARRLASMSQVPVTEVTGQMALEAGNLYLARGDADLMFRKTALGILALPVPSSSQHLWHPSVTRMVESALTILPAERLIGVELTGMGDDGAKAMTELRRRGGRTIAQDEASCVVFGMPQELIRGGGASVVLPPQRIAAQLVAWLVPAAAGQTAKEAHGGAG